MKLTAVYRKVPEGYIGFVEELPGAKTAERGVRHAISAQGKTLDEARANLQEAIEMTLLANRIEAEESLIGKDDVIRESVLIETPNRTPGRSNVSALQALVKRPSAFTHDEISLLNQIIELSREGKVIPPELLAEDASVDRLQPVALNPDPIGATSAKDPSC